MTLTIFNTKSDNLVNDNIANGSQLRSLIPDQLCIEHHHLLHSQSFFYGLVLKNNYFIGSEHFKCCNLQGLYPINNHCEKYNNKDKDKESIETYISCSLKNRLSMVNNSLNALNLKNSQLAASWKAINNTKLTHQLSIYLTKISKYFHNNHPLASSKNLYHLDDNSIINRLNTIKKYGTLCEVPVNIDQSYFDGFCLGVNIMLNWRFNLQSYPFNLDQDDCGLITNSKFDVMIAIIKDHQWKKNNIFILEHLIDLCYFSNKALWIITSQSKKSQSDRSFNSNNRSKPLNARYMINNLKSLNITERLSDSAKKRLTEICVI